MLVKHNIIDFNYYHILYWFHNYNNNLIAAWSRRRNVVSKGLENIVALTTLIPQSNLLF